ncbi:hypothetical protein ElyMa_003751700 [Elysia marginata]|uniref:Yippee domain-containing protein n=1 Tax=Elysia marginata TaxID=1093978 RepID=A0AAV4F874_9GAST|nr:hypothetical protein ElyMa_003751700 [Elysia marginata]
MDEKKKKNTSGLTLVTGSRPAPNDLHSPVCEGVPHMIASASSPSLLTGCGDPSTPAGSRVEQHCHAHHINTGSCVTSPDPQNGPIQVVEFPASPAPLVSPIAPSQPQDNHILTPFPPPRRRNLNTQSERPNSAPPHHLERISGVLLRLIGDHYLCLTCGRELRTIGDQLALETDIRRAFSSSYLYSNLEDSGQEPN